MDFLDMQQKENEFRINQLGFQKYLKEEYLPDAKRRWRAFNVCLFGIFFGVLILIGLGIYSTTDFKEVKKLKFEPYRQQTAKVEFYSYNTFRNTWRIKNTNSFSIKVKQMVIDSGIQKFTENLLKPNEIIESKTSLNKTEFYIYNLNGKQIDKIKL